MNRRPCLAVLAVLLVAAAASALEVVRMTPKWSDRVARTDQPLVVVFDDSLDPASVDAGSFAVARAQSGARVDGTITLATTERANDTVVFTPAGRWTWGARHVLTATDAVRSDGGEPFAGGIPDGGRFVANIPNDFALPTYDPDDPMGMFVDTAALMGFNPLDPEGDPAPWEVPGVNVTGAWKYTTGRPEVIVAVLDDGIRSYANPEIRRVFFLNAGELPRPNVGGAPCAEYDCDGDGRFGVDDYAEDDRLAHDAPVSATDLIAAFADGVDDDGNGLTDDISGWDFLRGTNVALGIGEYDLGVHGDGMARGVASGGDDGIGDVPGVCPNCTILPIRAAPTILYDYGRVAAGVRYAASMGASVIMLAGVALTSSDRGHRAFVDAADQGLIAVAATGDEMAFHHWMPSSGADVLAIKSIFPMVPVELFGFFNLDQLAFTETFCTNYGPQVGLTVPAATYCTSDATANTAGMLGLLFSRARDEGIDLAADEARQLLTRTAYDIADRCAAVSTLFGVCHEGFDEHFGYGRPDLERAMLALGDAEGGVPPAIPPSVRLAAPRWWQTVDPTATPTVAVTGTIRSRSASFSWRVQVARGDEPYDAEFATVAEGTSAAPIEGTIAEVPFDFLFDAASTTGAPRDRHSFAATVRVQASYDSPWAGTVTGEARRTIAVHVDRDPDTGLVPGFPVRIGASGESAPVLYDLDGARDGRLEIVLGTGAGEVVALRRNESATGWENLPGFPVDVSGDDAWVGDTVFASVAVGDLFGDGTPEIVAATMNGRVYAIDPAAAAVGEPLLPGFPVAADFPDNSGPSEFREGNGFMGAPVLADLDSDGMLEIIAASLDQKVYAWKPATDRGGPERLAGWPVLCRSYPGAVPDAAICAPGDRGAPILGTPAVGILDPADPDPDLRARPSVIVTTNEACEGPILPETRVYAIHPDGNLHAGGPFLPGWPARPRAPFSTALPLPMIAGATASPAVAAGAGGGTIAIGSTGWLPQVIRYAGSGVVPEELRAGLAVNAVASPALSSLTGDGDLQVLFPITGAVRVDDGGFALMDSRVLALDLAPPNRERYGARVEDIPMLAACSAADLDGDGRREAIVGTGGYLVHAFSPDGGDLPGWPKFTGGWVMATPAVGDLDADGRLEVVANSREGDLYAWEATGPACANGRSAADWRRFHHDERNTGFYGADTLPPNRIADLVATRDGDAVRLSFTAPGDDWTCGAAAGYDVRYAASASDLTDPARFLAAPIAAGASAPLTGGEAETLRVDAPGAVRVAIRAVDETGNLGRVSETVSVEDAEDGDEEEDDDGACCG